MKNPRDSRALILSGFPVMNSVWMGTQMVELYLANPMWFAQRIRRPVQITQMVGSPALSALPRVGRLLI